MQPRERYTVDGPEHFGDAELIALVLGCGSAGWPVGTVAQSLLRDFGGVDGIASAPVGALMDIPGVGPARAVRLHAACALGRRRRVDRRRIRHAQDAVDVLGWRMAGLVQEELHGLYLDRRGGLLAWRRLSIGSDAFTIVDPRIVLRPAVQLGAWAMILAHNHPSGDPEPSPQDLQCTERVRSAAAVLGVQLLDHVILGNGSYSSLAERGLVALSGAGALAPNALTG